MTKRRELTQPQPREMLHPGGREKRRETERHFDGDRQKEIEETRTHTNVNTIVEAHEEEHAR